MAAVSLGSSDLRAVLHIVQALLLLLDRSRAVGFDGGVLPASVDRGNAVMIMIHRFLMVECVCWCRRTYRGDLF